MPARSSSQSGSNPSSQPCHQRRSRLSTSVRRRRGGRSDGVGDGVDAAEVLGEAPVGVVAVDLIDDNTVTVENVPSYRHAQGVTVDVPDVGPLPGVLTEFDPGELLLAGSDVGYGTPSGRWRGSGPVTEAPADDGPLGCIPVGSRVFWNGFYDTPEVGPGTHFLGKFRVFPTLP